jgi:hypothetical protein
MNSTNPMYTFLFRPLMVLAAVLFLAACSSTEPTVVDPPPPPPEEPQINMADYEVFDPEPYRDNRPQPAEITHDVPESLLDGKAEQRTNRSGRGYRIQVYSSQDKGGADRLTERARAWWQSQRKSGKLDEYPGPVPVYLIFRQPYYRVRVGNFGSRADALEVLRLIERDFPDAFLVPDQVTIQR